MVPIDLSHDFSKPLTIYLEVLYEDLEDTEKYFELLNSMKNTNYHSYLLNQL